MIEIKLSESQIEVFGHGKDETCSRVSQLLNDIEIMYFIINTNLHKKFSKLGQIYFKPGHTLITWDFTLDYNLQQFIKFSTRELSKLYPNTIKLSDKTIEKMFDR